MLIDTSAWIEFFDGSEKGKKVWNFLNSANCFTSIITITELTKWAIKNNIDYKNRIERIKKSSNIININEIVALLAGQINEEYENRPGIADSIIYATAKFYKLRVLTSDKDFSGLDDVEFI